MTHEATPRNEQDPTAEYLAELATHANLAAELTQNNGFLAQIATTKREADIEITAEASGGWRATIPKAVFETILKSPAKGERLSERWRLAEALQTTTKELVERQGDSILLAAEGLGMRRIGNYEDYSQIDAQNAVYVIEGGANKTSIVRRGVMERGLGSIYGEQFADVTVFQLGGNRVIAPTRGDGSTNPEHKTIRELAGSYLSTEKFTEFDANLATALNDGYEIEFAVDSNTRVDGMPDGLQQGYGLSSAIKRTVSLKHPDTARPALVQIQPTGSGLEGGFDAVAALVPLGGKQLVIASNGQYRAKDRLQAFDWAVTKGIDMLAPVALGDEPGDETSYVGITVVTPARPAAAYVNEIVLYGKQSAQSFMRYEADRDGNYPGSVSVEDGDTTLIVEPDGRNWLQRSGSLFYYGPNDPVGYYSE